MRIWKLMMPRKMMKMMIANEDDDTTSTINENF